MVLAFKFGEFKFGELTPVLLDKNNSEQSDRVVILSPF